MDNDSTVFPQKMDMNAVVVYYHVLMGKEAAMDGWEKEFEDLVDTLMIVLHTIFDKDQEKKWEEVDDRGSPEDRALMERDPLEHGFHKRARIKRKLMLAEKVIHGNKLGFRHLKEYKWDFDPESEEQRV